MQNVLLIKSVSILWSSIVLKDASETALLHS